VTQGVSDSGWLGEGGQRARLGARAARGACGVHMQTLVIYKHDFNQNCYTFTLI
jgi:hypothetical protein